MFAEDGQTINPPTFIGYYLRIAIARHVAPSVAIGSWYTTVIESISAILMESQLTNTVRRCKEACIHTRPHTLYQRRQILRCGMKQRIILASSPQREIVDLPAFWRRQSRYSSRAKTTPQALVVSCKY
jgi:hypothetical protein